MVVMSVLSCVMLPRTAEIPDAAELVILHAGGGYNSCAYLNAQETFAPYYDAGYRYFEYDFRFSLDGRLIGTHEFEWFDDRDALSANGITYDEFKQLKICDGAYTPIQEEWFMQMLQTHPDVKIVMDTKEDDYVRVYEHLRELGETYQVDLHSVIIPQIYSYAMWEYLRTDDLYDEYIYTNYKSGYNVEQMIDYFGHEPKVKSIAVATWQEGVVQEMYRLRQLGKNFLCFTPQTAAQVADLRAHCCNGFYVDDPQIV